MTRDEVIRLAEEAGFSHCEHYSNGWLNTMERFAELVAQHEREAVMQLFNQPHMEYFGQEIQDAIRARSTT